MRRGMLVAATIAALILTATACSATPQPQASLDLPAKDQAAWVMPLDQFHVAGLEQVVTAAEDVLIAECLAKSGVEWPATHDDIEGQLMWKSSSQTWSNIPLMTKESAQKWGYGFEPAGGAAAQAKKQARAKKLNAIADATPGFEALFRPCLTAARKQLPPLSDSLNQLVAYVWDARDAAANEKDVRDAAARWRACLQKAGYSGLPNSPVDAMPTDALRAQVGIPAFGKQDGGPIAAATPQEITLALADVACRDSSGWAKAQYAAEWDQEVKILNKNADRIVRDHDADLATLKKDLAVLAAHPDEQ